MKANVLSHVPEKLMEAAIRYEKMRAHGQSKWPPYMEMYGWLLDASLTFEDIGVFCGTTRERIRQVCDEFFPGVRPEESRRTKFGRNSAAARKRRTRSRLQLERQRRREALDEFQRTSPLYCLLKRHAEHMKLALRPVIKNGYPAYRSARVNGEKCCLMCVRTATQVNGSSWYAHAIAPVRATLEKHRKLIVLLDIRLGDERYRRMYRISAKTFLKKGLSYVLIRLGERNGNGGGTKAAIAWQKYLVSTL